MACELLQVELVSGSTNLPAQDPVMLLYLVHDWLSDLARKIRQQLDFSLIGAQSLLPGFGMPGCSIVVLDEAVTAITNAVIETPTASITRAAIDDQIVCTIGGCDFTKRGKQSQSDTLSAQITTAHECVKQFKRCRITSGEMA